MKLTAAQQKALEILGTGYVEYSAWGGKLMTRLPDGIRSRATLWGLSKLGLANCQPLGTSTVRYTLTHAGRQALKSGE